MFILDCAPSHLAIRVHTQVTQDIPATFRKCWWTMLHLCVNVQNVNVAQMLRRNIAFTLQIATYSLHIRCRYVSGFMLLQCWLKTLLHGHLIWAYIGITEKRRLHWSWTGPIFHQYWIIYFILSYHILYLSTQTFSSTGRSLYWFYPLPIHNTVFVSYTSRRWYIFGGDHPLMC